jgi:GNAT superfamily N-acetyltransferase
VDDAYQRKGIGKELIRQTKIESPQATLILLSAPKAIDCYPHVGMEKHEACFILKNIEDLK